MKSTYSINRSLRLVFFAFLMFFGFMEARAQSYPEINGAPCTSCVPTAWTMSLNTPDLISGNGFWPGSTRVISGISGPSIAGGNMTLLTTATAATIGYSREAMSTFIVGLVSGKKYTVSVYWQGGYLDVPAGGEYTGGSLDMIVDGVTQTFTSSDDPLTDDWRLASFTFTATSGTATLELKINRTGATGHISSGNANQVGMIVIDDAGGLSVVPACNAGIAQVALNAGPYTNTCPATTVDLNSFINGTSTLVKWFTNNTHTGTPLASTTVTPNGSTTYYAFYYDAANDCYNTESSNASVTPTLTVCTPACNANAGTISRQ